VNSAGEKEKKEKKKKVSHNIPMQEIVITWSLHIDCITDGSGTTEDNKEE
jgi:hypothetical protein